MKITNITNIIKVLLPLLLVLCLAACGGPKVSKSYDDPKGKVKNTPYKVAGKTIQPFSVAEAKNYVEIGMASWYGSEMYHKGRVTANGEKFDENLLTGAHKMLPLPVYVQVTNLENGRSVIVRINDRGPFKEGRIIDLSRAAAKELGFVNQGSARVKVEFVCYE